MLSRNTLTGLQETDPHLKELFRLYRPSPWQLIVKLQIPSAIPYIPTGIHISAGLVVIGAIVGEFIAGGGLGSLIDAARVGEMTLARWRMLADQLLEIDVIQKPVAVDNVFVDL